MFPTVYRRIYCRKFMTLSNQTSRCICTCIRIVVCHSISSSFNHVVHVVRVLIIMFFGSKQGNCFQSAYARTFGSHVNFCDNYHFYLALCIYYAIKISIEFSCSKLFIGNYAFKYLISVTNGNASSFPD